MKPQRFHDAPLYFRRVYDMRNEPFERREGNVVFVEPLAGERLVIFGYSVRSEYPEDHAVEERGWKLRRAFPAFCFSPRERDGEYGSVPVAEVEPISQEQFEAARGRGWAER